MSSPNFSQWPARDQAMWDHALRSGSPLDAIGGLSHLRPGSLRALRQAYRHWLHWLQSNEPKALQIAPEERATIEKLHRWYDTMTALRPMSRLFYIEGTIKFLRAIAPEGKWDAHRRLILRLKRLAGRGDKSRKSGRILDSGALSDFGMNYVNCHLELTRQRPKLSLRIDPCATLPLAEFSGGLRSDRHGTFEGYSALGIA